MRLPVRWLVATPKPPVPRLALGLKAAAGPQCRVASQARGLSPVWSQPEGTTPAPL